MTISEFRTWIKDILKNEGMLEYFDFWKSENIAASDLITFGEFRLLFNMDLTNPSQDEINNLIAFEYVCEAKNIVKSERIQKVIQIEVREMFNRAIKKSI